MASLGMFSQVILDGTEQLVYTVPEGKTLELRTLWLTNTSSGTFASVSVHLVSSADSVDNKNLIIPSNTVAPLNFSIINPGMSLQAGFKVYIKASEANIISCNLSGVLM